MEVQQKKEEHQDSFLHLAKPSSGSTEYKADLTTVMRTILHLVQFRVKTGRVIVPSFRNTRDY